MSHAKRLIGRLERRRSYADWPRRRLEAWTDEELAAVLDAVIPGYRERVERMTGEELESELRRFGML